MSEHEIRQRLLSVGYHSRKTQIVHISQFHLLRSQTGTIEGITCAVFKWIQVNRKTLPCLKTTLWKQLSITLYEITHACAVPCQWNEPRIPKGHSWAYKSLTYVAKPQMNVSLYVAEWTAYLSVVGPAFLMMSLSFFVAKTTQKLLNKQPFCLLLIHTSRKPVYMMSKNACMLKWSFV